ncbi:hypothetical protein ACJX0J_011782, partial [Zea mays]
KKELLNIEQRSKEEKYSTVRLISVRCNCAAFMDDDRADLKVTHLISLLCYYKKDITGVVHLAKKTTNYFGLHRSKYWSLTKYFLLSLNIHALIRFYPMQ